MSLNRNKRLTDKPTKAAETNDLSIDR